MTPMVILAVVTLVVRTAGRLGITGVGSWRVALRGGLAAMFVTTGLSHFVGMREEMIQMVPPALPAAAFLVTATGVLELLGALGLLRRTTAGHAAAGLFALLVAMFPANVHAALEGPMEATPLVPRTLMQLAYLTATGAVAVSYLRERRLDQGRLGTGAGAVRP